jgi:hypothetical protein
MPISRPPWLGGHAGLRPDQLHKEEVFALLMMTGRGAGFTAPVEAPAPSGGFVDMVWVHQGRPVVVFEIDGRDVARSFPNHLPGNARKFLGFRVPLKVQVLYSAKNCLDAKPPLAFDEARGALPADVWIVTDEQLLAGELDRLVAEARMATGEPVVE